uniref:Uncharacterized protein n=1 Tax=Sphaerodactylus townsendi TaxID=933632 RepID=A0ACB8F562_9SAUR
MRTIELAVGPGANRQFDNEGLVAATLSVLLALVVPSRETCSQRELSVKPRSRGKRSATPEAGVETDAFWLSRETCSQRELSVEPRSQGRRSWRPKLELNPTRLGGALERPGGHGCGAGDQWQRFPFASPRDWWQEPLSIFQHGRSRPGTLQRGSRRAAESGA